MTPYNIFLLLYYFLALYNILQCFYMHLSKEIMLVAAGQKRIMHICTFILIIFMYVYHQYNFLFLNFLPIIIVIKAVVTTTAITKYICIYSQSVWRGLDFFPWFTLLQGRSNYPTTRSSSTTPFVRARDDYIS